MPFFPPTPRRRPPGFPKCFAIPPGGSRDLLGLPVDPSLPEREITRLADRLRPEVSGAADGGRVVDAFRRVLLVEEGFAYDKSASDPQNYLLEAVLARKKGNCLGLSMV